MNELRDLYQQTILDHSRQPRNCRILESADRQAEGYNPLCGDHVTIYLNLEGDKIADIAFQGSGCAISTASISLLTEALKGLSLEEFEELFKEFHALVATDQDPARLAHLGKLTVFQGVREFPARVKCATLSWHTVKSALEDQSEVVKTE